MYKGERFNGYTHLAGAISSVVGLVVLLYISINAGDPWKIVSFSIYGSCLLILYLFSTLYHSFKGKVKGFFQKLDHISIYLLIAGTYTPFTLVSLRGEFGWVMFATVWALAITGITLDVLQKKGNKNRHIQLSIYLIMGWLAVFAIEPLMSAITINGFYWLIAGGLFYTAGVLFYVLSTKHRFAHGIWHLFVLAGSLSHFVSIAVYV